VSSESNFRHLAIIKPRADQLKTASHFSRTLSILQYSVEHLAYCRASEKHEGRKIRTFPIQYAHTNCPSGISGQGDSGAWFVWPPRIVSPLASGEFPESSCLLTPHKNHRCVNQSTIVWRACPRTRAAHCRTLLWAVARVRSSSFRCFPRLCSSETWEIFTVARHFGAEIVKVEPPNTGDPLRVWRELDVDGTSPWFRSIGRNKKSVTIDMRKEEGRACVFLLPVHFSLSLSLFMFHNKMGW
jgi:hypothetical protein